MSVLPFPTPKPQTMPPDPTTVAALEALLALARAGEVREVLAIYSRQGLQDVLRTGQEDVLRTGPYRVDAEAARNAALRLVWRLSQG